MDDKLLEYSRAVSVRTERTRALIEAPDAMKVVVAHIVDGGSLVGLCDLWDVRFSDILRWINEDKARLRQYTNALADRTEWVKESVLQILRTLALRADIRKILNEDGTLKPVAQWPDDVAASITSIEIEELFEFDPESKQKIFTGLNKKVKMVDKLAAIKLLGQTLAMFTERHEVEHKLTFEQLIGKAHKGRVVDVTAIPEPKKLV